MGSRFSARGRGGFSAAISSRIWRSAATWSASAAMSCRSTGGPSRAGGSTSPAPRIGPSAISGEAWRSRWRSAVTSTSPFVGAILRSAQQRLDVPDARGGDHDERFDPLERINQRARPRRRGVVDRSAARPHDRLRQTYRRGGRPETSRPAGGAVDQWDRTVGGRTVRSNFDALRGLGPPDRSPPRWCCRCRWRVARPAEWRRGGATSGRSPFRRCRRSTSSSATTATTAATRASGVRSRPTSSRGRRSSFGGPRDGRYEDPRDGSTRRADSQLEPAHHPTVGSSIENRLPWPASLWRLRRAPWAMVISLAM